MSGMNQPTQAHSAQFGASLIEVLVSILVISFGILGMAGVQTNAVRFHKTTEYRATATLLLADMVDRMRANRTAVAGAAGATPQPASAYLWTSNSYTPITQAEADTTLACTDIANPCSVPAMAADDLVAWKKRLFYALPGASGYISDFDPLTYSVDLWVVWQDPDEPTTGVSTAAQCPTTWKVPATASYRCMFVRVAI